MKRISLVLVLALAACGHAAPKTRLAQSEPPSESPTATAEPTAEPTPSATPSPTPTTPPPPTATRAPVTATATTTAAPEPLPVGMVTRLPGTAARGPANECGNGAMIEGVVLDTSGHPLEGVYVGGAKCASLGPEMRTGADGRFAIHCAPDARDFERWVIATPWKWETGHLGSYPQPTTRPDLGFAFVERDEFECGARYRFMLQAAATLKVHVRDQQGQPSSENVGLTMVGHLGPWPLMLMHPDGEVVFHSLAPGTYDAQYDMNPAHASATVGVGETGEVRVRKEDW